MNITCKVSQRDHDIAGYRKVSPEVWMHEPLQCLPAPDASVREQKHCFRCEDLSLPTWTARDTRSTSSRMYLNAISLGQRCGDGRRLGISRRAPSLPPQHAHSGPHLPRLARTRTAPPTRPRPHGPAPVSRMRDCLHSPAVVPLTPPYPPHPIQSTL